MAKPSYGAGGLERRQPKFAAPGGLDAFGDSCGFLDYFCPPARRDPSKTELFGFFCQPVQFDGLMDGFRALERLKRYPGLEFGVLSSSFAFDVVCVRFGFNAAPTDHNQRLATGLIFWGHLRLQFFHGCCCHWRAACRVFFISMAMVIGPTPPGTGVMCEQ